MSPAVAETERHRALFAARSTALARRRHAGPRETAARQAFLVCVCGAERFGLPVAALAGVLRERPCVPVPGSGPALRGIIAHAGAIVSVIDLGLALGLDGGATDGEAHFVRLRAQEPAVALAVDRALGVAEVPPDAIVAPADGGGSDGDGLEGGRRDGGRLDVGLGAAAISGYCPAGSDDGTGVKVGFSVIDPVRLLRPFLP